MVAPGTVLKTGPLFLKCDSEHPELFQYPEYSKVCSGVCVGRPDFTFTIKIVYDGLRIRLPILETEIIGTEIKLLISISRRMYIGFTKYTYDHIVASYDFIDNKIAINVSGMVATVERLSAPEITSFGLEREVLTKTNQVFDSCPMIVYKVIGHVESELTINIDMSWRDTVGIYGVYGSPYNSIPVEDRRTWINYISMMYDVE